MSIPQWVDKVQVHPDVLAENFSEDIFALDLGPLSDGKPTVPKVYRDAESFVRSSYFTEGLLSLLQDVLVGLEGKGGNRVLKLLTPFGGGKSHTLASLFHAASKPDALDAVPETKDLPRPSGVNVAVFDGAFFDATTGKEIPELGTRAKTMWGWIGWALGGKEGYELIRPHDEARVAPGGDVIIELLGEKPNLILLDEVLQYLISAGGIKVGQTTIRDETLTFLQRLTTSVGSAPKTALVFTLQSSKREAIEYVNLLNTVDHLAARKDQRREPVEGNEVLKVIQRRLLNKTPEASDADPAALAYQENFTAMKRSYASGEAERRQAEEEGVTLRDRIRNSYPFHPALIDVMRERWAAIPDFQRTRGALRFLAACLRYYSREEKSRALLGPGDVPLQDSEVRQAFFKEVGQQADFQAVLEHDFIGANSRVRQIDDRRARENPQEAQRKPAMRLATTILMNSFGGLRRQDSDGDLLPPGISEPELLQISVGPDLDSTTALACLKEIREKCLYLHFDGVRYCFKKDPNVTMLLEQEAESISRDERRVRDRVRELLEERLGGQKNVIVWPEKSGEVPDKEPQFLIGFLAPEFASKNGAEQEKLAKEILERFGEKPRQYRNGLALAIPADDQVEILRRSVRYLMAAEAVEQKSAQHNLTAEQKSQLKERKKSEEMAVESAFQKLYMEVWLPKLEGDGIGLERVTAGGRPLNRTLDERRRADVYGRVHEIMVESRPVIFNSVQPHKIVEFFRLGTEDGEKPGLKVADVVDGFYGFLGLTRLTSARAISECVAKGVLEGFFGLTFGVQPTRGDDGRYQVGIDKFRFRITVPMDEVDLETGFIMAPGAVPTPKEVSIEEDSTGSKDGGMQPGTDTIGGSDAGTGPAQPKLDLSSTKVSFKIRGSRNKIFGGWQAIANLADQAGEISITVEAEKESGFDQQWLENGVFEPLREADLLK